VSTFKQTLGSLRASAAAFWNERTEQERRFLAVGGAVVGLALVYALLIDPALSGRERLRKELPQLHQEAAQLQALATQAAQLAAQPPVQPQPFTRDALMAALKARGLTAQNLVVTGDYVKAEFKDVPFAGLVTWLDGARRDYRLLVQDAKFSAQDKAGSVDATLTLRQEAGPR
jgi:general secretion pathway protein M